MKDRLLLKDATTYRVRTLDGKEHVADWDDAHRQFLKPYEKRQRGPAINCGGAPSSRCGPPAIASSWTWCCFVLS